MSKSLHDKLLQSWGLYASVSKSHKFLRPRIPSLVKLQAETLRPVLLAKIHCSCRGSGSYQLGWVLAQVSTFTHSSIWDEYFPISWINVLVSTSKPVLQEAKLCCSPGHQGDPAPFYLVPSDLEYFLRWFFSLPLPGFSFPPSSRKPFSLMLSCCRL